MIHTGFVRFLAEDGIELQGMYFTPADATPRNGVICVHGMAGSFYEHPFVEQLAHALVKQGYAFLTFNNRGHGYLTDLIKQDGAGWTEATGGRAYDIFEECLYDIGAACQWMKDRGVTDIGLVGHSSGTNKVVYYQYCRQNSNVQSVILLSPNDDIGLQREARDDQFGEVIDVARTLVESGNGEEMMPVGPGFPISAGSYLDYFGPETRADIFPFRDPEAGFREIGAIRCPLFVLIGSEDECVPGDKEAVLTLLREKAVSSPQVDTAVVAGAPHDFRGRESELVDMVAQWLRQMMIADDYKSLT